MVKHLSIIAIALVAGSIAGVFAERVCHSFLEAKPPQIAVVDLKKLILEHQDEVVKKYPGKLTEAGQKEIEENAAEFARKLSVAINQVNKDNILIVKEAVIGESRDLTEKIKEMMANDGKNSPSK